MAAAAVPALAFAIFLTRRVNNFLQYPIAIVFSPDTLSAEYFFARKNEYYDMGAIHQFSLVLSKEGSFDITRVVLRVHVAGRDNALQAQAGAIVGDVTPETIAVCQPLASVIQMYNQSNPLDPILPEHLLN